jgi:uncharacterized protein (DUF433 family)
MDTDALIQERNGEIFVGPTRVLVWVIAAAHERGETPEQIQASFPTLSLAQVRDVIAYYLEHRVELDARFAEDERAFNEWWTTYRAANVGFHDAMEARFEAARKQRRELGIQAGEVAEA